MKSWQIFMLLSFWWPLFWGGLYNCTRNCLRIFFTCTLTPRRPKSHVTIPGGYMEDRIVALIPGGWSSHLTRMMVARLEDNILQWFQVVGLDISSERWLPGRKTEKLPWIQVFGLAVSPEWWLPGWKTEKLLWFQMVRLAISPERWLPCWKTEKLHLFQMVGL